MIEIYLENIQSIDKYLFQFPERGIVQFRGNNSNGKSILGKAISRIVFQHLIHDDKRLPLIQDGQQSALVTMKYNNRGLVVKIDKDVNNSFYGLIRENGEKVRRGLREGGIDALLREFGFVVYGKNLICLQVCETFGLMPFINTPDVLNGEIVNSVTTDIPSEQFLECYDLTFKEAKQRMNAYNREIDACQASIDNHKIKDVSGYRELIDRASVVLARHEYLQHVDRITLEPFPKMEFNLKRVPELEKIPIVTQLPAVNNLFSLDKQIVEMRKIKEGKCPMCGKPLLEGGRHTC